MTASTMLEALEQKAMKIPSQGGTAIGAYLQNAVINARKNTNVIEIGTWLGAGTAQLALGALKRDNPHSVQIHTYDKFKASASEVDKAKIKEIALTAGEDTLPKVKQLLSGFESLIHFHKINLKDVKYPEKKPISVYVDDAAKNDEIFTHMLKIFSPHWIPGETILILMDFNYWQKCPDRPEFKYQTFIINKYPESFRILQGRFKGCSGVAIKYEKPLSSSDIEYAYNSFQKNLPPKSKKQVS